MKIRADIFLTDNNYMPSREKAKAMIMAGNVYINGEKIDKAGTMVDESSEAVIKNTEKDYVSRGGYKLEKAVNNFGIDLNGSICMDIGASTGGFTDCMLKNGAQKVYSIDVGYGQLAWSLRTDSRVVVLERTNIRHLTKEQVSEEIDFASVDVSFISLKLVLPVMYDFLREDGGGVILIKPQFEAGREFVGKNGVVKDKKVHEDVMHKIYDICIGMGFSIKNIDFSPITGPKGNIEYLFYIIKNGSESSVDRQCIEHVAEKSHTELA